MSVLSLVLSNKLVVQISCNLVLTFALLGAVPSAAEGGEWLLWQTTNVQLLRGEGFELAPNEDATIVTLEHAHRWRYGDFYGFVDYLNYDQTDSRRYAEITPRLSLSKLTGATFQNGIVRDVFVAGQIEFVESVGRRYMKGLGFDLKLPGFKFFKANLFHRNNPQRADSTWQVYLAWRSEFQLGRYPFAFEGFADFFGEEGGTTEPGQLLVPRFLFGAGKLIKQPDYQLELGVEWQYWHNKFGVDGRTESVPQIQIKYNL